MEPENLIPQLREDIQIIPVTEGGESFLVLHDRQGYAPEPLALSSTVRSLLAAADGRTSYAALMQKLQRYNGSAPTLEELHSFFTRLDEAGFMDTSSFEQHRQTRDRAFLNSTLRPAACAGISYAADPTTLQAFLRRTMASVDSKDIPGRAQAIVVPHIDLRVGSECYAPVYHALKDSDAEIFVIFATSHYGWQDLFIPTEKDFETPLGIVQTDRELLAAIRSHLPFDLTHDDLAHRDEHSIEFQLLFLQYLFPDRPFTIVPILVTSFHPFIERGILPAQSDRFRSFIHALYTALTLSKKKVAYIASADMAHVGRKFGDAFDAATILESLRTEDAVVLEKAVSADADGFFQQIAKVNDRHRICGLSPIYSLLEAVKPQPGILLDYRQWHEESTNSAVTFAGLAYYDKGEK